MEEKPPFSRCSPSSDPFLEKCHLEMSSLIVRKNLLLTIILNRERGKHRSPFVGKGSGTWEHRSGRGDGACEL